MEKHDLARARYFFNKIRSQGYDSRIFLELAQVALRKGDRESAEKILRDGIQKMPNSAKLHNDMGAILLMQGRVAEAISHFETSYQYDPVNTTALKNLVDAHISRSQWAKAIGIIEEGLASFMTNAQRRGLLAKLSVCYYLVNDREASFAVIDKFARAHPRPKDWAGFGQLALSLKADPLARRILDACLINNNHRLDKCPVFIQR